MKRTKKTLGMLAGIIASLGLAVSASADMTEAALLTVAGGTTGHLYSDCNYNPIYAYGEVYSWHVGRVVCEARSYNNNELVLSTGDCTDGDWQRGSVRTSTTVYHTGPWVSFPNGDTSFAYATIRSRDNSSASCIDRLVLAIHGRV